MSIPSFKLPLGGRTAALSAPRKPNRRWLCLWIGALSTAVMTAEPTPTQLKQYTITDRQTRLTWLRCSVGQRWNGFRCIGAPRMLTWEQANEAAAMAKKELGGNWRLPTVEELQTLVCDPCAPPKIDQRLFPDTPAAPFWSASSAPLSVGRVWTVNFYTGHLFGRNTKSMERYVRLVKAAPTKTVKPLN